MNNYLKDIQTGRKKIAVIGLGYVGLPLACAFGKKMPIIGFDINSQKIDRLTSGVDDTGEVSAEELAKAQIEYISDPGLLKDASFYIVAVPTPIDKSKQPDLRPLYAASKTIAPFLKPGDIVVYESTVYPGVTEDECGAVLEKVSGLKCGLDFFLGYSPERINPGDREHSIEKIIKIVSGQTPEVLAIVAGVYGMIIDAGIHQAPTIRVAEAAKVIENTQRDINIALMNELSIIFNKLGIETRDVLAAAGTKWNWLPFTPGLVGGHCIGVDPYYLTHKAEEAGYHPQMILAGRRINDGMGKYVAEQTVKCLIRTHRKVVGARVLILGLTFKENITDARNSRVKDIISELKEYDMDVIGLDPHIDAADCESHLGITPCRDLDKKNGLPVDAVIVATRHDDFKTFNLNDMKQWYTEGAPILIDVKWLFQKNDAERLGFVYRSL